MSWAWTMAGGWLLPGVLAGGLLLLVTRVLARCAAGPARRQRLADCGVAAALLAVALSFGPRWLSVPLSPARPPEPAVEPHADDAPAVVPEPAPAAPRPRRRGCGSCPSPRPRRPPHRRPPWWSPNRPSLLSSRLLSSRRSRRPGAMR